ncbi:MAG: alcohol dehydrogenase catalytic domain-containing protein [Planctomycetota bacterium]
MKAVELYAPGKVRLRDDASIPEPGPGEVRVKVLAAGICGTDVHICSDDPSMSQLIAPPVILGHEFCGHIDAMGPEVNGKLAVGDYVSAEMHEVCRDCPACENGQFHACANTKIRGVNLPGAFAEHVIVSASNVVRLPADLPPKVGAILDPLGNAVHTALKVPVDGRKVGIIGFGPIGAMCAEVVLFAGAKEIAKQEDVVEQVIAKTGGGTDVTLEISGNPIGINNALRMTRAAGDIVNLGLPKADQVCLEGFGRNFIFRGLTMHAVIGREMFRTWDRMLELLRGGLDVAHFVTAEIPLDEFDRGLERFRQGLEGKVVMYPGGAPA